MDNELDHAIPAPSNDEPTQAPTTDGHPDSTTKDADDPDVAVDDRPRYDRHPSDVGVNNLRERRSSVPASSSAASMSDRAQVPSHVSVHSRRSSIHPEGDNDVQERPAAPEISPLYPKPEQSQDVDGDCRKIKPKISTVVSDLAIDLALLVISVLFLSFAILVRRYDGASVAKYDRLTKALLNATDYGPSVFPILFAAVVGRATKYCILWRLEKGEKLGLLDLLACSTTVVNAVLSQVSLRSFSVAGCALAILWACSPLGSQAALRIMSIGRASVEASIQVDYMTPNGQITFSSSSGSSRTVAAGLFVASILSPTRIKTSSVDTWNNVKIPMLESLNTSKSAQTLDGWYNVGTDNVTFSALIGFPVSVPQLEGVSRFNIETSYWVLDYPTAMKGNMDSMFANATGAGTASTLRGGIGKRMSKGNWTAITSKSSTILSFPSETWDGTGCNRRADDTNLLPRTIGYQAWSQRPTPDLDGLDAICSVSTSYVEAEVECSSEGCDAKRVERSALAHPPAAWTSLGFGNCEMWYWFAIAFLSSVDVSSSGSCSIVQGYLAEPERPTAQDASVPYLWDVPNAVLADRFAQLLNTFWLAAIGNDAIPNNSALEHGVAADDHSSSVNFSTTAGTFTRQMDVIECHNAWFVVLLVSSSFLVLASLVPPVIRLWTKAPALTFNVSTTLRDSPYFTGPYVNSTMDSSDRSRLLKDTRVRYGDVAPESEVGHVAIGSIGSGNAIRRVNRRRLYD